ncbi:MAG: hypothetical protein SH808_01700 [Saprospiraceae bacterium]|nr:hypothetical protein [Saprospiraceae bacterium]
MHLEHSLFAGRNEHIVGSCKDISWISDSFHDGCFRYQDRDVFLIDELNLFINPTAIGEGLTIFSGKVPLYLDNSTRYGCGIVVNKYLP